MEKILNEADVMKLVL